MPTVSLSARVLYFIWKRRGVPASYDKLAQAMDYQDDRRIRDVVDASLREGTLRVKVRRGVEYWETTNKAEDTIGLFILPLTQIILIGTIGAVLAVMGLEEYFLGYHPSSLTITGLGVIATAIAISSLYLQRKFERRILKRERENPQ